MRLHISDKSSSKFFVWIMLFIGLAYEFTMPLFKAYYPHITVIISLIGLIPVVIMTFRKIRTKSLLSLLCAFFAISIIAKGIFMPSEQGIVEKIAQVLLYLLCIVGLFVSKELETDDWYDVFKIFYVFFVIISIGNALQFAVPDFYQNYFVNNYWNGNSIYMSMFVRNGLPLGFLIIQPKRLELRYMLLQ